MKTFVVFTLLFVKCLAIFKLSDISISKGIVTLNVENGAKLYVSSNDDEAMLDKIKITNNLSTMTALDLVRQGTNLDGTAKEWKVTGQVTISSTNTEMEAERLTGFVYFTTFTQALDQNFLVFSVNKKTVISYDNSDLTVVFLNQNLKLDNGQPLYVPQMSSRVTDFIQGQDSTLSFYWNEPTETYKNPKADDSQQQRIFSNPLLVDFINVYHLFDSVQPLQIFNEVWYMRSKGQIRFQVEPKWEDPNETTTSAVTTTGFVMCSYAPENLTITMKSNPANAAISGFAYVYNVISPVTFKMSLIETSIDNENLTKNNIRGATVEALTSFFSITSKEAVAGRYAIQYFQVEGAPLPTTTPGPSTTNPTTVSQSINPTTPTVPTTTKTAASVIGAAQILILIAIIV